jgi:hypothetical protein
LSRNGITSSGARHHQRRPTAGADRSDRRPADLLQRAVDAGDGGNHGGDRAADRVVRRVQPAHHPFDRGNGAEMSVDIVEIALRAVVFGGSRPSLQSRWAAGPIEPPAPLIHIRRRGAGADHGVLLMAAVLLGPLSRTQRQDRRHGATVGRAGGRGVPGVLRRVHPGESRHRGAGQRGLLLHLLRHPAHRRGRRAAPTTSTGCRTPTSMCPTLWPTRSTRPTPLPSANSSPPPSIPAPAPRHTPREPPRRPPSHALSAAMAPPRSGPPRRAP